MLASFLVLVEFVRNQGMLPVTARTNLLSYAATAKEKVVPDDSNVETLPVEQAWAKVLETAKEAAQNRDLDDFREAIKIYQKAVKDVSYDEIERSFRANDVGIYLIAVEPREGEILDTHTLVNLAGKRDCKYKLGYFFKKTPRTAKMAEGWPSSESENLERLKDAGVSFERGVPKCFRCKGTSTGGSYNTAAVKRLTSQPEMGHTGKDCKEERPETEEMTVKCFNCDEEGHRARDLGHFAKDCPNNPGGGRACRNCGEEGHMAKECDKPKNPANSTCRNCDQVGHFSKDCPEPRDWSKVKCNNCGEMGHTVKRCPQAAGGDEAGFGTDNAGNFDSGAHGFGDANGADAAGAGNEAGASDGVGWMNAEAGAGPSTASTWGAAPATAPTAGVGW
ncbi:MAG: hypothetical protein Q9219_003145 [cf. Caloplaca sp. 3 TL-2023]